MKSPKKFSLFNPFDFAGSVGRLRNCPTGMIAGGAGELTVSVGIAPIMTLFRTQAARLIRSIWHDVRWSWQSTERFFNRCRYPMLLGLAAVLSIAIWILHPYDRTILDTIRDPETPKFDRLAGKVGQWGDFLSLNLLGVLLVWSAAALGRARWVQRVAVAALVSAILSGVACNVFRFTLGRARPHARVEDRFYGLPGVVKGWRYHGFPSGHTTTAVAGASTFGLAVGPAGAAVIALSGSVAWARMYKRQHYPTDVLVGAYLGLVYGLATGWRLRKIRLRLDRMKRARRASRLRETSRSIQGGPIASAAEIFCEESTTFNSTQVDRATL